MVRRGAFVGILTLCLALLSAGASATEVAQPSCAPGAPGIGDPYFPLDGNGGYDVRHYLLDLAYDPETDVLDGRTLIAATATQDLSSFNLDLQGLEVRSVHVNGRPVTWSRDGAELTVTPGACLREGRRFITVVRYAGVPETLEDFSGFIHTDDGALVIGQPDVAATWFPANDHPIDKASFTFNLTAPEGLEVVANGVLTGRRVEDDGTVTWRWRAREPMAPYLAMMTIGEYDLRRYREGGISYVDALDPDLFAQPEPRTGEQYALSQVADLSYKRLTRTITVPADGAELSFWVTRDTELDWDYFFVEAHPVGSDDWTTLPDLNGHTTQGTGNVCPYWLGLHPFLEHYQTAEGEGCTPTGTTGDWWAATGSSDGYEQWAIDLSAYAGSVVEVSLSYASDDSVQGPGVFVDDVEVSTGEGSTSFEDDGDTFDGWTVPGAPEGSEANPNDWIAGTVADAPPTTGDIAEGSLARQPEIIDFLSGIFGPYPFSAAGGIVDDVEIGFALETQTRPIYSLFFFGDSVSGDSVVVHELAHQWFGDSLALERWRDIWLNEGFASYAEWLWSEREGLGTAQEIFDFYAEIPADDPFWALTIGDPGPDGLFDGAVYNRGAMTLHALRLEIGDEAFFLLLRGWAQTQEGGNVTTDEFIALAERVSGQQLDEFFEVWLYTPAKPPGLPEAAAEELAGAAGDAGPDQAGLGVGRLARRE